jgi:hypothetical protein
MEDAQIVQGVVERRIEDQIESLTAAIESGYRLAEETRRGGEATLKATESLLQVVGSHEGWMVGVEDRTPSLEAAMKSLFELMDRFIRGLESNGHKQGNP